jgi:hypothetical protein
MMTPTGQERAAAAGSSVNALRVCFGQALACRLEQHTGRLSWDAQRLAGHQRDRLAGEQRGASDRPWLSRSPGNVSLIA